MTQGNENWIEWNGGDCPVDGNKKVYVKIRSGGILETTRASDRPWKHTGRGRDILAYRFDRPQYVGYAHTLPKHSIDPKYRSKPEDKIHEIEKENYDNLVDQINKEFLRDAWVKFAAAAMSDNQRTTKMAYQMADWMLEELKKRIEDGRL